MNPLQNIKQRFGIIGNNIQLNRALEKAVQVSTTDISVLVIGESGVGKEFIPKIIHHLSHRKHKPYIAVNCGAIPEGTIDSELFGHEKGSFTGADKIRKGYFEEADGGTIFLDEVGELPIQTQVRLLRVLESGEIIKVGSSSPQKTNVRIVAATNANMLEAVQKGKFREDLYYRLNTVQINIPALRERKEDIGMLLLKFTSDFSLKYRMPSSVFSEEAQQFLLNYYWPGNVRQLRNFAEQITVLESQKELKIADIKEYLPQYSQNSALMRIDNKEGGGNDFSSEREILYKILFDMRQDINDLKNLTKKFMSQESQTEITNSERDLMQKMYQNFEEEKPKILVFDKNKSADNFVISKPEEEDFEFEDLSVGGESLSLHDKEKEMIISALEKYKGKRKLAADQLGISERTLYRKIKQYDLE